MIEVISTFSRVRNHLRIFYRENVSLRTIGFIYAIKTIIFLFFVADTNAAFVLRRIFALDKYHNNSRRYYFPVEIPNMAAMD